MTIAAGGKRRVISALVATVVPWREQRDVGEVDAGLLDAGHHALDRVVGVDGDLGDVGCSPLSSSSTQTSVKVPPTSTATRYLDTRWSLPL